MSIFARSLHRLCLWINFNIQLCIINECISDSLGPKYKKGLLNWNIHILENPLLSFRTEDIVRFLCGTSISSPLPSHRKGFRSIGFNPLTA